MLGGALRVVWRLGGGRVEVGWSAVVCLRWSAEGWVEVGWSFEGRVGWMVRGELGVALRVGWRLGGSRVEVGWSAEGCVG